METSDIVIIGGGIVGLATALQTLRRMPGVSLTVLEKEPAIAHHQTGHNSGVIHSGIYYKPGSLKAVNCRRGRDMLIEFCQSTGVPFDMCGKVIVAIDDSERQALARIFERGKSNGVECEIIGRERLVEIEPHAAGVEAIIVRDAGIVSYPHVCQAMAREIERLGGRIMCDTVVTHSRPEQEFRVLATSQGDFSARLIVNCAGLQSDRVARALGASPGLKIVPFRGEYYELAPAARSLCRNLIYPVPDAKFPFLGVHFTRMIEGGVECGPNAVLALGREAYSRGDVNITDLVETLGYPAFWKLSAKHWKTGAAEIWRSISKPAFVRALQRLMPEILSEHLTPAPAGIRAQALATDGTLLDDFAIIDAEHAIHVCNAPSPAATSSLSIGLTISERIEARLPSRATF
ncbi:MAG: L-2-hydroxyglutarate oxidase [Phycisphaeraceae bacterium]|nr:L-2-hydroxyglutarate oxidase [Phycisphaeraceae bacterium]MCW5762355.1 L-2-hydroxyglutarate oxidase [Phycisphaeraceae bacterium]